MKENRKTAIVILLAMLIATVCLVVAAWQVKEQIGDQYYGNIQFLMSLGNMIFLGIGIRYFYEYWSR